MTRMGGSSDPVKAAIVDAARAEGWECARDVFGGGWRAGVYAERQGVRLAVLVQLAEQSTDETAARTALFEADGVAVAWLVGPIADGASFGHGRRLRLDASSPEAIQTSAGRCTTTLLRRIARQARALSYLRAELEKRGLAADVMLDGALPVGLRCHRRHQPMPPSLLIFSGSGLSDPDAITTDPALHACIRFADERGYACLHHRDEELTEGFEEPLLFGVATRLQDKYRRMEEEEERQEAERAKAARRLAELEAAARRMFPGNEAKASRWARSGHPSPGGRRPAELAAQSADGLRRALCLLAGSLTRC